MKTFQISFAALLISLLTLASIPTHAEMVSSQPFIAHDSCPTASFSIANNNVNIDMPVNFINESTGATAYFWDFGDGSISTAENPSHVYGKAGTYTVKLMVIGGGCTVEFIGTEDVIVS